MTKRNLPSVSAAQPCTAVTFEPPQSALSRWNPSIQAAAKDDASISVFDPIGFDPWSGEGVTAKRIAAVLRNIGGGPVTVNVNSPGGDMFEGLAIYNLLREYEGEVTVKVLGVAASAASLIAMAGDRIEIGRSAFLMIHNCWVFAAGNKEDLRAAADWIEPFDKTMSGIYAARTGADAKVITKMLDAETWIGGEDAVQTGFADALLPADQITEKPEAGGAKAARALDIALAKSGMPRSERRRLINEIKGTPSAAPDGTPCAADTADMAASTVDFLAALARIQSVANRR